MFFQKQKTNILRDFLELLAPAIIEGVKSIYNDAIKICEENDEQDKYLMTFQNYLTRVPKWNSID